MRRRRQPVVWLPVQAETGNPDPNSGAITAVNQVSIKRHGISIPAGSTPGVYAAGIFPVVGDWSNDQSLIVSAASNTTFADMYAGGYKLRRIVGHIWPYVDVFRNGGQGNPANTINAVVTVAFQVMQTDDSGNPVDAEAGLPDIYANAGNPWIWRRSWILTDYTNVSAAQQGWGVQSVADASLNLREGAFFDQKTARRIGPDQRLFLCLQATSLDGSPEGPNPFDVTIYTNYRTLATLTKGTLGNRRHSSR